jgi:hypothetical protein
MERVDRTDPVGCVDGHRCQVIEARRGKRHRRERTAAPDQ